MAVDQTFVTKRSLAGLLGGPVACGCGLLACAAYLAVSGPAALGPACPFRALTGWWCPGCGLTRATHHLLRGHVATALRYNALAPFVLAAIAAAWATWMLEANGRRVAVWRRVPWWGWTGVVVAAIGFGVVRNLPGIPGLRA